MANLTDVLFGNRLFAAVTYSENYDPQTLTATLSDTQSTSDADVANIAQPLSDSQSMTEALIKQIQKALSDTQSSTDVKVASLLKTLADSQGSSDALVLATGKSLTDLMTLTEAWITSGNKALSESSSMSEAFAKVVYHTFSDSFTATDAMSLDDLHNLMESMALSDSLVKTVNKIFIEITTSSPNLYGRPLFGRHTYSSDLIDPAIRMIEEMVKLIQRALADTLFVIDSTVQIQQTKGFLDFLILQEWVSINLKRVNVWSASAITVAAPTTINLYGRPLYGSKLYAANPLVSWYKAQVDNTIWGTGIPQIVSVPSLYAQPLFGQALFSDKPITTWGKVPPTTESWINFDGQNNQEV